MVKRPAAINVTYIDQEGESIEKEIEGFSTRLFLHEFDHISGRTMTHWRVSEGKIDILDGKEDNHKHMMTTVEFYRGRIEEMKA